MRSLDAEWQQLVSATKGLKCLPRQNNFNNNGSGDRNFLTLLNDINLDSDFSISDSEDELNGRAEESFA